MSTKTKNPSEFIEELNTKKAVARFFFKGGHTHPVRRTILIITENKDVISGYEFREGSKVRNTKEALRNIKTYDKSKIARWGDYSRIQMTSKAKDPNKSTLERVSFGSFIKNGA